MSGDKDHRERIRLELEPCELENLLEQLDAAAAYYMATPGRIFQRSEPADIRKAIMDWKIIKNTITRQAHGQPGASLLKIKQ